MLLAALAPLVVPSTVAPLGVAAGHDVQLADGDTGEDAGAFLLLLLLLFLRPEAVSLSVPFVPVQGGWGERGGWCTSRAGSELRLGCFQHGLSTATEEVEPS